MWDRYIDSMGSSLRDEVDRQLCEDLAHYGLSSEGMTIDWQDACGEGHCTQIRGGPLEEVSGLAVLDDTGEIVAEGWMDFIHGGGNNPFFVFWLFLSISRDEKWLSIKREPQIPEHLWARLPEETRQLCTKAGAYDARWSKDPLVRAWKRERASL